MDLVTFTEKIHNVRLYFLCSGKSWKSKGKPQKWIYNTKLLSKKIINFREVDISGAGSAPVQKNKSETTGNSPSLNKSKIISLISMSRVCINRRIFCKS